MDGMRKQRMAGIEALSREEKASGKERNRRMGKWSLALLLVMVVLLFLLSTAEASAGEDRIVVELQGATSTTSLADRTIGGTNNVTRQDYKFRQERWGTDFHYLLNGLSLSNYYVEFSFFEPVYPVKSRIFSVYANGSLIERTPRRESGGWTFASRPPTTRPPSVTSGL